MKKILLILPFSFSMSLLCAQGVGIGTNAPLASLDIVRGTAPNGTAMFRGTTHTSHFNFGSTEDTYIRGGKDGSNVIINDGTLGNVGIGTSTPAFKLSVYNSGYGIVHANTDGSIGVGTYVNFGAGWLGTLTNHPLQFFTNNGGAQVTLLQNGNLGIGTTNPAAKLHIIKDDEALRLSGTSQYISFFDGSNNYKSYIWNETGNIEIGTTFSNTNGEVSLKTKAVQGLTVQSDGRVRVGTLGCNLAAQTYLPKLSVHGPLGFKSAVPTRTGEWAIHYAVPTADNFDALVFYFNGGNYKAFIDEFDGSWNQSSDFRLKENFENYKSVLDGLKKLDVLTYHYKANKTGTRSFGLVAQNLQQYFPELVSGNINNKDEYLAISYGKTGVLAIKAIQEQQVIIEALEKRIAALESERKKLP